MFKLRIKQRTIRAILLGEACTIMGILVLFVLSHRTIQPTGSNPSDEPTLTYEESELRRIPHQGTHYPLILFSVPAQEFRADTDIRFHYRTPEHPLPTYLQLEHDGAFEDYALAFHPLMEKLTWPSIQEGNFRLYQRNGTYRTIREFLSESTEFTPCAIDRVVPKYFDIDCLNLDNISTDDTVDYILTSYKPPRQDGLWKVFDRSFDFSNLQVNSYNELVGRLSSTDDTKQYETPIYIGDFHVDYKKMRY